MRRAILGVIKGAAVGIVVAYCVPLLLCYGLLQDFGRQAAEGQAAGVLDPSSGVTRGLFSGLVLVGGLLGAGIGIWNEWRHSEGRVAFDEDDD